MTTWNHSALLIWIIMYASDAVFAAQTSSSGSNKTPGVSDSKGNAGSSNSLSAPHQRPGPQFDRAASKNVTALLGKTAYLNCRVKNLGNKTISWVRHRDIHLLTVGRYTYTSDQRFRAINHQGSEDWCLQIKYPQHRDTGIYECQISTTPHMSHFIHLNVVEPTTDIIGGPDLYIDRGSTINLTCVVLYSPEPPAYIFWNHNEAIISYDSPRGGVSVITEKGETTTSFLLIQQAKPDDSGRYQCNPSNAQSRSINVHVLNESSGWLQERSLKDDLARNLGSICSVNPTLSLIILLALAEFPAAMQHGGQAHHRSSHLYCLVFCVCLLLFTT